MYLYVYKKHDVYIKAKIDLVICFFFVTDNNIDVCANCARKVIVHSALLYENLTAVHELTSSIIFILRQEFLYKLAPYTRAGCLVYTIIRESMRRAERRTHAPAGSERIGDFFPERNDF